MGKLNGTSRFLEGIEFAIKEEIKRIEFEEVEAAKTRIEKRISQVSDKLALNLLAHYDVRMDGHRLLITVDKTKLEPRKESE